MRSALILLLPLAASAQLAVVTYDGATETPAGSVLDFGKVAGGDTKDVRFRARNTGISAAILITLSVAGAGFSLVNPPATPYTIAPGNFVEFPVRFVSNAPAAYSANLQVNSVSVLLLATTVPVPTLTAASGCAGPDLKTRAIDFGRIQKSVTSACTLALQNFSTRSLGVAALTVAGSAFGPPQGLRAPLTLLPGERVTFTIAFSPPDATTYSGTLTIDTRAFPLMGAAYNPVLPKPALTFDSSAIGSAQQHTLKMSLPSPATFSGSGYVNLVFAPATKVVTDDPAVMFLPTGTRTLPFSFKPGETLISIDGQAGAVFATGTTAGVITFQVTPLGFQFEADPATPLPIPPATIGIDTLSATRRANDLDIEVIGYDNTYTAGVMSFTFYDKSGNAISPGAIQADFTSAFNSYFTSQAGGSAFLMRVTFPVTGTDAQVAQVAGVDVALTNSAGVAQTQRLRFP
jgi:hypothetical protein